ncbi:MAG TPA: DsbA family oxidoreductase [Edaphocola sp.]|nr:DsbA family oxidoreductase [Edaphocola sp.]
MKIEIWSDVICPFCYIGKRNFEAALKQFEHASELEIVWKSFQLDPSIPEDLEESQETYLSKRKGLALQQVKAMLAQVSEMARGVGLQYQLEKSVVANTKKAHRLIQMAKTKGLGDEAEESLFHAFFIEGRNIADNHELQSIGLAIGLSKDEVSEALSDAQYEQAFHQDLAEAQQLGISGVPFFVFDRKYGISGAQPVPVFVETLKKSYAEWRGIQPSLNIDVQQGPSCDVNGNCS